MKTNKKDSGHRNQHKDAPNSQHLYADINNWMHKQINGVKVTSIPYSRIPNNKYRSNNRNLPFGKHFSNKYYRQEQSVLTLAGQCMINKTFA